MEYESGLEIYLFEGNRRYRVSLPDGIQTSNVPLGIAKSNDKIIWLQANRPGEIIHPHDLVQAIGEGLEESGLYIPHL